MLKNIVDPSELLSEQEYYELKEDIYDECAKFGILKSLEIPRPIDDTDRRGFIGKVFLEYATLEEAKEARRVPILSTLIAIDW